MLSVCRSWNDYEVASSVPPLHFSHSPRMISLKACLLDYRIHEGGQDSSGSANYHPPYATLSPGTNSLPCVSSPSIALTRFQVGNLDKAFSTFSAMAESTSISHVDTILKACIKAHDLRKIKSIVATMRRFNIQPSLDTYKCFITINKMQKASSPAIPFSHKLTFFISF